MSIFDQDSFNYGIINLKIISVFIQYVIYYDSKKLFNKFILSSYHRIINWINAPSTYPLILFIFNTILNILFYWNQRRLEINKVIKK